MSPRGNLKVVLENRGELTLRPSDHVATGGEGTVYRAGETVVKIYLDAAKMVRDGMHEKFKALAAIQHPYIMSPQGLVSTPKGDPLGFYTKYVDGEPLSRVFTNAFRQREGFTDQHALQLTEGMREVVIFAHEKKAILVDPNELNWFAVNKVEPRIIDVDSWQIGRWPAMAIMPSIRDWHTKGFNQLTDWFAWGVVSFQVFTGIHPYKGGLDGYSVRDLEKRMKDNASVFTDKVRLNQAVRAFDCIPGPLLDWYRKAFHNGERSVPPSPLQPGVAAPTVGRVAHAVVTGAGVLIFERLYATNSLDRVAQFYPCGVVRTQAGNLVNLISKRVMCSNATAACEIVAVDGGWLKGDVIRGAITLSYINANYQETPLQHIMHGYRIFRYENRLFLVNDNGLTELVLKNLGRPILAYGNTWGVMVNSTKWFDGIGIQDSFGATFVIAPFGPTSCLQVRVRELDGLKPVAAKAGHRFITIVAVDKNGDYQKIELAMSEKYDSYRCWQATVDTPDLNIAILPKGVCASIVRDGELDLFVPRNGNLNKVSDSGITTDMLLDNWDDRVVYLKDGEAWAVRMK